MVHVEFSGRSLPILRTGEIAVVGASFAGIAAALEFAQSGRKVVLIEPRTYPGREITATLRPWITLGEFRTTELIDGLVATARGKAGALQPNHIPLHPDKIKIYLEDTLLAAGIDFLYASLPIGIVTAKGKITGLVIANKSGRQVIACETIVDATETAVVARVAATEFEPESTGESRWRRTLEFDQVKPLQVTHLTVPQELQVAGNILTFHQGYVPEDLLVECEYDLSTRQTGLRAMNDREIQVRHRSIRLAAYLIRNVPEFTRARLGTASHDLLGTYTTQMVSPAPDWAAQDAQLTVDKNDSETIKLPLSSLASSQCGVWCLNESARVPPTHLALFQNPVSASLLGQAFAQRVLTSSPAAAQAPVPADTMPVSDNAPLKIKEPESPQRGKAYRLYPVPSQPVPVLAHAEVLVAGGGTSGATAARVAAEEGAHTVLIELNPGLGGTATFGGVDAYWAGRHVGYAAQVKQRVNQIHDLLKIPPKNQWNHQAKMYALLQLTEEAGVETYFNVITVGALLKENEIHGTVIATRLGPYAVLADRTVDATGDGDVAAFAGAGVVYGSERDHVVMWFSLNQQKRPGRTQGNFTSMVDISNIEDYNRAILSARRRGGDLYDHGIYVATRESRHIVGDARITLTDILLQRAWNDVVNIHFSNYDLKGKSEADWELLGIVPPNIDVEIPYGAMLPQGLENLLVTGKAFSATHDALPGTRMQADLENLGGVAGLAAAMSARAGVTPRKCDVREIQTRLVAIGLLPRDVLTRTLMPRRYTDADLRALIDVVNAQRPLHAYSDQKLTEVFRGIIPEVELGTAGPRVVPFLERAHAEAHGERKIRLAQLLCFVASKAGVNTLVSYIESNLHAREELPPRESFIRNSNLPPPDQAAMPELVYLIYTLGMARDRRSLQVLQHVAELLAFSDQDLWDFYSSPFLYVDAVASVSERLGDPEAIPILEKILAHPLLHNQLMRRGFQADFIQERLAMLELAIARAMARCGSPRGFVILINYLNDARALMAEQAHTELVAITANDFGKDSSAWSNWLEDHVDDLELCPVLERLDLPEEGEVILRPSDFMERMNAPYLILPHPDFGKQMVPQYE